MADNNFAQFIEELRISRNLSREDFVDGIISTRQYQRFLNGESSIKNDVIEELIARLKLDLKVMTQLYYRNTQKVTNELNNIQVLVGKLDFKSALDKLNEIDENSLSSESNILYYKYLKIISKMHLKLMAKKTAIEKLKTLIGYPEILENETISFAEYNVLLAIYDYLYLEEDDPSAINYLYQLMLDNDSKQTKLTVYEPPTYANIAATLIKNQEYSKALHLIDEGIKISYKHSIFGALAHLFFYKAYAIKMSESESDYKEYLRKTFAMLYVEGAASKNEYFNRAVKKYFNIKKSEIFEY